MFQNPARPGTFFFDTGEVSFVTRASLPVPEVRAGARRRYHEQGALFPATSAVALRPTPRGAAGGRTWIRLMSEKPRGVAGVSSCQLLARPRVGPAKCAVFLKNKDLRPQDATQAFRKPVSRIKRAIGRFCAACIFTADRRRHIGGSTHMRFLVTAGNTQREDRRRPTVGQHLHRQHRPEHRHGAGGGRRRRTADQQPPAPGRAERAAVHRTPDHRRRIQRPREPAQALAQRMLARESLRRRLHDRRRRRLPAGAAYRRRLTPAAGRTAREQWVVRDVQAGKVKSTHPQIAVLGEQTEKLVDLFRTEWAHKGLLVKFKLEVGIAPRS